MLSAIVSVAAAQPTHEHPTEPAKGFLGFAIRVADRGEVEVVGVREGSPAASAGMQAGDHLARMAVAGKEIDLGSATELTETLAAVEPGDEATIVLRRHGEEHRLRLVAVPRPAELPRMAHEPVDSHAVAAILEGLEDEPNQSFSVIALALGPGISSGSPFRNPNPKLSPDEVTQLENFFGSSPGFRNQMARCGGEATSFTIEARRLGASRFELILRPSGSERVCSWSLDSEANR